MSRLLVFAFLFFIGCCLGWVLELLYRRFFSKNNPEHKWINPGFLKGPYLPIYGFGLWGMYFVSGISQCAMTGSKLADTLIILVIMAIVMTVIELIGGLIFTHGMKVKLWDYSNEWGNFKGIICPKFTLYWGILGCFYYFVIDPYVIDGVVWLSTHLTFSFFIGFFFGVFVIDVWYSMRVGVAIRSFASERGITVRLEEFRTFLVTERQKYEEKKNVLIHFRNERFLRQSLEKFIEEKSRKLEEKKQNIEERIEETLDKIR